MTSASAELYVVKAADFLRMVTDESMNEIWSLARKQHDWLMGRRKLVLAARGISEATEAAVPPPDSSIAGMAAAQGMPLKASIAVAVAAAAAAATTAVGGAAGGSVAAASRPARRKLAKRRGAGKAMGRAFLDEACALSEYSTFKVSWEGSSAAGNCTKKTQGIGSHRPPTSTLPFFLFCLAARSRL